MIRSISLAEKRGLLRGPDCRVWFLGERVCGWQARGRIRRVTISPPYGMFHTHMLRGMPLTRLAWERMSMSSATGGSVAIQSLLAHIYCRGWPQQLLPHRLRLEDQLLR